MTTATKFKKPNKNQIINELLPIRREQIKKDWEAARAEYREAEEAFKAFIADWVKQNPSVWTPFVGIGSFYAGMRISCFLVDDPDRSTGSGTMMMPPHLLAEYNKLEALETNHRKLPNPNQLSDHSIRKIIREELDALDPKSIIDNTPAEKEGEMPVMKEYLEQFMATLTKVSKARARLAS
jgi:hypothetical protein